MNVRPYHAAAVLLVFLAGCAHHNSVTHRSAQARSDTSWIVGTWESIKLDYGNFREWRGTSRIQIVAFSPNEIDLVLIDTRGGRRRAHDSWPGLMESGILFFGPIGSGLSFQYRFDGEILRLHLDASGRRIDATLRRVGPPPPETERLPGRPPGH